MANKRPDRFVVAKDIGGNGLFRIETTTAYTLKDAESRKQGMAAGWDIYELVPVKLEKKGGK